MEENSKFRVIGGIASSIVVCYYCIEIKNQIQTWYSYDKILELTVCSQVYGLELWLLMQSVIWCISIVIMIIVFAFPHMLKLMLCFLYLIGPLFFILTGFAIIAEINFIECCNNEQDKCLHFYPYKASMNFLVLLIISLLFSISVSVLLVSIVFGVIWDYMRDELERYENV
jgi:hypothetical protein